LDAWPDRPWHAADEARLDAQQASREQPGERMVRQSERRRFTRGRERPANSGRVERQRGHCQPRRAGQHLPQRPAYGRVVEQQLQARWREC
jgi:hypothetical protein